MKKIILSLIIVSMSITPVFAGGLIIDEFKYDKNKVNVYTNKYYISSNNSVAWAYIDSIGSEEVVFLRPGFATITDLQTGKKFNFEVNGTARTDETALQQEFIDSWVSSGTTDMEKLKNMMLYFYDNEFIYYPYSGGFFTNHGGDCTQYSDIVKRLCDKMGIPCYIEDASYLPGAGSNHQNNICYIDGHYYMVDLQSYISSFSGSYWRLIGLNNSIKFIE